MSKRKDYEIEGVKYPHVTSIIRVLDKGEGLLRWVAKLGYDESRKEMAVAAARGIQFHNIIAKAILKQPYEVDEKVKPYIPAMLKFLEEENFRPHQLEDTSYAVELTVHSRRWGYAGTLDAVGSSLSSQYLPAIYDWKTAKDFYEEYQPQTAAYQVAYLEQYGLPVNQRIVVLFHDDGTYKLKSYFDIGGDFAAFKACLDIYNWRNAK